MIKKVPLRKRLALWEKQWCFYQKPEEMPHGRWFWLATGLVTVAILLFCLYFITLLTLRHDAFQTNAEDLGIMDQAVWNTLHGSPLHQTICNILYDTNCASPQGFMRFGIHFEPMLLLISGFYWIWANPKMLLILQTLVIASGAYPAFWLARLRLRNEVAGVVVAVIYLLNPAQQQALGFDFHTVAFTAALLLYTLYFLYTRRTIGLFIFVFLSIICREEISLVIAMMGLWSIVFQLRWRTGLSLFLLGVVWFSIAVFVIMPHFSPTGNPMLMARYGQDGEPPAHLITSALLHPKGFLLRYLWEPNHLEYLKILFSPEFYLPLLAPWILIMALPSLAINMLSSNPLQYSGLFHYNAEIVPFLIFATIEALLLIWWALRVVALMPQSSVLVRERLHFVFEQRLGKQRGWFVHACYYVVLLGFLAGVGAHTLQTDYYINGQMPFAQNFRWPSVTAHQQLAQHFIDMIPADASVSSQTKYVPHLSHRRYIYMFPYADDSADYILLDVTSDIYPFNDQQYMVEVQKVLANRHYHVLAAQDGLLLLKRGNASTENTSLVSPAHPAQGEEQNQITFQLPPGFCSSLYPTTPSISYPIQANVETPDGGQLTFLGYDTNRQTSIRRNTDAIDVTTYWRVDQPSTVPVRLLFLLQDQQNQEYLLNANLPLLSWCPSTTWEKGQIVRINSQKMSLQWTKVPDGLAHMSIGLLPLVQSSSTIMDVQARLPLHMVHTADSVTIDQRTNTLQLMSLQITSQ